MHPSTWTMYNRMHTSFTSLVKIQHVYFAAFQLTKSEREVRSRDVKDDWQTPREEELFVARSLIAGEMKTTMNRAKGTKKYSIVLPLCTMMAL